MTFLSLGYRMGSSSDRALAKLQELNMLYRLSSMTHCIVLDWRRIQNIFVLPFSFPRLYIYNNALGASNCDGVQALHLDPDHSYNILILSRNESYGFPHLVHCWV